MEENLYTNQPKQCNTCDSELRQLNKYPSELNAYLLKIDQNFKKKISELRELDSTPKDHKAQLNYLHAQYKRTRANIIKEFTNFENSHSIQRVQKSLKPSKTHKSKGINNQRPMQVHSFIPIRSSEDNFRSDNRDNGHYNNLRRIENDDRRIENYLQCNRPHRAYAENYVGDNPKSISRQRSGANLSHWQPGPTIKNIPNRGENFKRKRNELFEFGGSHAKCTSPRKVPLSGVGNNVVRSIPHQQAEIGDFYGKRYNHGDRQHKPFNDKRAQVSVFDRNEKRLTGHRSKISTTSRKCKRPLIEKEVVKITRTKPNYDQYITQERKLVNELESTLNRHLKILKNIYQDDVNRIVTDINMSLWEKQCRRERLTRNYQNQKRRLCTTFGDMRDAYTVVEIDHALQNIYTSIYPDENSVDEKFIDKAINNIIENYMNELEKGSTNSDYLNRKCVKTITTLGSQMGYSIMFDRIGSNLSILVDHNHKIIKITVNEKCENNDGRNSLRPYETVAFGKNKTQAENSQFRQNLHKKFNDLKSTQSNNLSGLICKEQENENTNTPTRRTNRISDMHVLGNPVQKQQLGRKENKNSLCFIDRKTDLTAAKKRAKSNLQRLRRTHELLRNAIDEHEKKRCNNSQTLITPSQRKNPKLRQGSSILK